MLAVPDALRSLEILDADMDTCVLAWEVRELTRESLEEDVSCEDPWELRVDVTFESCDDILDTTDDWRLALVWVSSSSSPSPVWVSRGSGMLGQFY